MTGQQRNILAAMGVDLWVPRTVSCQKKQTASLWRDQVADIKTTNNDNTTLDQIANISPVKTISDLKSTLQPTIEETTAVNVSKTDVDIPSALLQPVKNVENQDLAVVQTEFTLEAYCLDQVVLMVESSQLSKQQRQLWHNIQAALTGVYNELKWPFPLENFRDARGVQTYVQGFLDALATDKRIVILGELEVVQHAQVMQLASLQDMIDQPLLKRRLWQLMLTP
ncbi:hypothetical protein [Acinetobacter ihumii]|uniref:hypothetical protein n=1 Tax=Acinetobacter ihumii TaxID=2483802 RepID=UPI00102FE230|nr:hypothetical protein [Acinetobacter ihumii]